MLIWSWIEIKKLATSWIRYISNRGGQSTRNVKLRFNATFKNVRLNDNCILNSDKFLALVASDDIHGDSGDVCEKKYV